MVNHYCFSQVDLLQGLHCFLTTISIFRIWCL